MSEVSLDSDNEKPVKKLAPEIVERIKLQNHARRQNGLSEIEIKTRACIRCGQLFESTGHRNCGCLPRGSYVSDV